MCILFVVIGLFILWFDQNGLFTFYTFIILFGELCFSLTPKNRIVRKTNRKYYIQVRTIWFVYEDDYNDNYESWFGYQDSHKYDTFDEAVSDVKSSGYRSKSKWKCSKITNVYKI